MDSWKNIGESKRLFFVLLSRERISTTPGLGNSGAGQFTGKCPEQLALSLDLSVFRRKLVGKRGWVWFIHISLFVFVFCVVCVFCGVCCLFLQNVSFNSNKKVVSEWHLMQLLPIYTQRLDDLNEGFGYSSNLTTTVEDPPMYGTH